MDAAIDARMNATGAAAAPPRSAARYVVTIETPLSAEAAFAYMADVAHFADWDPGVARVEQVEGTGAGPTAVYDVAVRTGPTTTTMRYGVVKWSAPHVIVLRAVTPLLQSFDEIRVETVDGHTRVTYDARLSLRGPLGLANRILAPVFNRIGDRAAVGLRRVLGAARADENRTM